MLRGVAAQPGRRHIRERDMYRMQIRTLVRASARLLLLVAILVTVLGLLVVTGSRSPAHASGCGTYVDTSTSANTTWNWTTLLPTDPNAIVFVNTGWNGTYDDHPIGVWYTGTHWAAFNQDVAAMPLGVQFHVTPTAAFSSPSADVYVHTATTTNVAGDSTILDDPLANGNPNAIVQVTANWNPGGVGGTYNDHAIGVWYTGSRWAIFNEDLAAMPVGAHFNVFVRPGPESHPNSGTYVHTSTNGNISGNVTYIPSPTTSFNTVLLVTPNYNPGGVGGALHNRNIGVWYNFGLGEWSVFNQDVSAMAAGHSFNVSWQSC
jgi:hypothetical protein